MKQITLEEAIKRNRTGGSGGLRDRKEEMGQHCNAIVQSWLDGGCGSQNRGGSAHQSDLYGEKDSGASVCG